MSHVILYQTDHVTIWVVCVRFLPDLELMVTLNKSLYINHLAYFEYKRDPFGLWNIIPKTFLLELKKKYQLTKIIGVLENPLYAPNCEHAFCEECISEWLNQHQNCPLGKCHINATLSHLWHQWSNLISDRQPLLLRDMKPIPRIMKNLLGKLR